MIIYDQKEILERAKFLRKNLTKPERLIWRQIKQRQLLGYKFLRQVPCGNYIVDFMCVEAKLIVEIDGGQHGDQIKYDRNRTVYLEKLGFRVVRFWNHDVLNRLEVVLKEILKCLVRGE